MLSVYEFIPKRRYCAKDLLLKHKLWDCGCVCAFGALVRAFINSISPSDQAPGRMTKCAYSVIKFTYSIRVTPNNKQGKESFEAIRTSVTCHTLTFYVVDAFFHRVCGIRKRFVEFCEKAVNYGDRFALLNCHYSLISLLCDGVCAGASFAKHQNDCIARITYSTHLFDVIMFRCSSL